MTIDTMTRPRDVASIMSELYDLAAEIRGLGHRSIGDRVQGCGEDLDTVLCALLQLGDPDTYYQGLGYISAAERGE